MKSGAKVTETVNYSLNWALSCSFAENFTVI